MKNKKNLSIVFLILLSLLFVSVNFVPESKRDSLPNFLSDKALSLGLDLKGGAYISLELDTEVIMKEKYLQLKDTVRTVLVRDENLSREDKIRYKNLRSSKDMVSLNIKEADKLEEARDRILNTDYLNLDIDVSGNKLIVRYSEKGKELIVKDAIDRSMEIVRRRIDSVGTKESSIQRQGDDRIVVQLPGVSDPEDIKSLIGKTAKMTFQKVNDKVSPYEILDGSVALPADSELLNMADGAGAIVVYKDIAISGENLSDSRVGYNQNQMPVVEMEFDLVGTRASLKFTSENIGNRMAIVLDGKVLSDPTIQSEIGSRGQITGNFNAKEAKELAAMLKSGALPAPLNVVEERTVGAGLGADSIAAGKFASVLGLVLVAVFMVLSYGMFGLFADIVLICNMLFIFALLGIFGSTLTLPGIAGIVLTIGMAVDANVLIFERIREESANGLSSLRAIEEAFSRAVGTILDSNITTFVASIVLFQFGTGPIKGFAVTLAIGILTTLFSSIIIGKILLEGWGHKNKNIKIPFV
ncbi:MAG: protein translocase subunit SecD [Alphaproteobacteria bacterium]|jgi:preprotein translocase subunit SecD|nr:protein translocase subunit SecD [Alphaproteobacteria bacterium]